jgi:two-component system, sensor histidine kinase and response regulator
MHRTQTAAAHILVVDDTLQNRLLAEARLVTAGYRVSQAASGEEGLAAFAAQPPDLVLLDVRMPGLDGFDTLVRLRELPNGRDVPVVFLTALDDEDTHRRALEGGADDFLTKPLRPTELLIRVRSLLRLREAMRSLHESHELVSTQRDALIRARDLRERLSAFIIHDLKSPLSNISAASELLARRVDNENARGTISMIQRGCSDMNRMVMNLLDVARTEDGQLQLQTEEFDLRGMLDDVIERIRATRGQSQDAVRFETEYDLDNSCIHGDPELLRRVMENLIDNALRYSPARSSIRVHAEMREGRVDILVRDQGPGIPEEHRERVFEMYERLNEHHDRAGRGLGLVFCRAAVEAHGGAIWIDDTCEGPGATFHVRLSTWPSPPPAQHVVELN